jgi:glucuronoarabinoxylan endo-1,4-beta-xylanase
MKSNFSKSAERPRLESLPLLVGLILSPYLLLGQVQTTNFYGTVTFPPQVDAINFNNFAVWNISTAPLPFQTAQTLNYTNESTMTGSLGWEFDYGPSTGGNPSSRGMSASFFNDNSGTIQALDGSFYNPPNSPFTTTASYLLVSATNIVNKGLLIAGANGEIVLNGGTVSLARSGLEIIPISGVGSSNSTNTFSPDTAIYDELWQTNVLTVNGSVWDGTTVAQLTYTGAGEPCGVVNVSGTEGPITPQIADSYVTNLFPYTVAITNSSGNLLTNVTLYSNVVEQASFVAVSDPNISAINHFSPALVPTNYFQTVAVRFAMVASNVVTLATETDTLYVVDDLASSTNDSLLQNSFIDPLSSCTAPSYRPSSVIVSRIDPILNIGPAFASGAPGLGPPPTNFFDILTTNSLTYSNAFTTVSNSTAVGRGDLYSADAEDLPAPVPSAGEGENISNVAGRITISANNLDLTRTRMLGLSLITIDATNLIGSVGAAIDCQNLSYNLGSTTGLINVTNLVEPSVTGLHGTVEEWSGVWTNFIYVIFNNNYAPVVANNVTNWVLTPLTNLVEVDAAVTVVDGTGLSSTVPTTVQNLVLTSTNMVVSDEYVNVVNDLLFAGSSLTINSSSELELSGSLQNWNSAIAPNLQYFTNNGFLLIPNNADFGGDTASPYVEFVNTGYITAYSQTIHSLDLQITGGINDAGGDFSAVAQSMEITGPTFFPYGIYSNSIYASGSINLYANTLQLNQAAFFAGNMINFYVTNSLSDNGSASALMCNNGLNLWIAPRTGSLSGTTVTNIAPGSEEIDNAWAGVDYGPMGLSAANANNAPIGTLALVAQAPSQLPLFVFYGTGGAPSNAMYVTTLDLSQLTSNPANLTSMIQINPGMKIYVSQVLLGFTPPGGQSPIGYVQSQFPGQIVLMPNIQVAQSGSVDWNTTYQAIDGFGASSAYDGTWSTNQADILFSTNMGVVFYDDSLNRYTNNGLGLSLLRNHIVYASTPLASDTPTTVETNIMLWAQQRGARVWSTPWTPAPGFKSIYDIYDSGVATGGGVNGGSYLGFGNNATNQAYASQLANYVVSMKNMGINLYAISVQNEPDADVTTYDACQWTGTQIHDFVTNLYAALAAKGVGSTKILLPESQNWQDYQNLAVPAMTDPTVAADVGIIADHNYDGANGPANLTKNSYGKPLWETEVSQLSGEQNTIANGVYYADRIYLFLTVAQASAWHYWWIFPYGSETGLMTENGGPTKRMFTVGQFSRFVRPGYVRIGANAGGGNLLVTAFKATNSQNFAIVAINTNLNIDVTQTFNLANVLGVSAVTPWMTSSSNSLAQLLPVAVSGSSFTYTVPAQSVVTFVGQGNAAPSSISISGAAYLSSGHSFVLTWNSTAGATYSVLKTNVLGAAAANWPVLVTGYPPGGAAGGSLSYTDTTATVGPAFYRIRSP